MKISLLQMNFNRSIPGKQTISLIPHGHTKSMVHSRPVLFTSSPFQKATAGSPTPFVITRKNSPCHRSKPLIRVSIPKMLTHLFTLHSLTEMVCYVPPVNSNVINVSQGGGIVLLKSPEAKSSHHSPLHLCLVMRT